MTIPGWGTGYLPFANGISGESDFDVRLPTIGASS